METAAGGAPGQEPRIMPTPNAVGRNALILGPLLLMALVAGLWYATSLITGTTPRNSDPIASTLAERRDQLLNHLADLDHRLELQAMDRSEHTRQREQGKRQLRRIALILARRQDSSKK